MNEIRMIPERWRRPIAILWIMLAIVTGALFAAGVAPRFHELSLPCSPGVCANDPVILGADQIAALAVYDVPHKVVKLAQSDHVLWKKRLANMVAGRAGLNANELADHHSCRPPAAVAIKNDRVILI